MAGGKRKRLALCCFLGGFTLAVAVPSVAQPFPIGGAFGLDLSNPATATCRQLRQEDVAKLSDCDYLPTGNAFGLPFAFHSCQAPGGATLLIYATQAQCAAALEKFQASAP